MLLHLFSAPSLLCSIHLLPHPLSSIVYSKGYALIFPWNFLLMLFFFDFSKNKKSRLFILFIFFFELSRVFLSPLLKSRWVYCFCFFPSVFLSFFPFYPNQKRCYLVDVLLWNCIVFWFRTLSPRVKLKTHTHR